LLYRRTLTQEILNLTKKFQIYKSGPKCCIEFFLLLLLRNMTSMKIKKKLTEINCIDEDKLDTKVKSITENDHTKPLYRLTN
jgi:hypothetical protein